jgi:hypothetical protein
MLKPDQIPREAAVAATAKGLDSEAVRKIVAAAINAWPGTHMGHQCTGCGGDPQIILPLTESSDDT